MSALLLPELAREMAGSNRRVAGSLEVESSRLENLRAEMKEEESLRKTAARSVRGAMTATLGRKADIVGIWQRALENLQDGLAGEQARELLQNVREIIDSWLCLAQNSRKMWQIAVSLGSSPEGLEELDTAEQEAKEVMTAVEKMQTFLTATRPPIDSVRLQKGAQDVGEGKFKSQEEMRSGSGGAEA